jgi:hypothetical protein
MLHQFEAILQENNELNPLIRIYTKIFASTIFNHNLSKFIKLAKIAVVQMFCFVEDECTFNIINFMKNRLYN